MQSPEHLPFGARSAMKKVCTGSKGFTNSRDNHEPEPRILDESARRREQSYFDQLSLACGARGVSLTKQASQTRAPSLSVKSILRVGSISAPHFPQRSVC